MVKILYSIEREFMRKTFESIDKHVDLDSAYLPIRPEARGCTDRIPEIEVDDERDIDANVRAVDPDVVVYNHGFRADEIDFHDEYPLVHIRHGASIGRGEISGTTQHFHDLLAAALAPGERWAKQYREEFPNDVQVATVGIPEADDLVTADPPRERCVLYAPTNHNYGGGSYLNTADAVLDLFADTDYRLLFRPHQMDQKQEPGRSVTERCRERIEDLPNVAFDGNVIPRKSMFEADVLISDYSGIVSEWLHTYRPLIQLTDLAADERDVPEIGYTTSIEDLTLEMVDDLYARGYSDSVGEREAAAREELGIPMDGRAGERAAREVEACTR